MSALTMLFISMSSQYSLPPGLLESVCWVETKHQADKIHFNDGETPSYGICQIKLETARWLGFKGTPRQLMEPQINIKYAAIYLQKQLKRYGQVNKAVIAYNQGHANVTTTKYQRLVFNEWSRRNRDKARSRQARHVSFEQCSLD